LLKAQRRDAGPSSARARSALLPGIALVLIAVSAFTLLATAGQNALPPIMRDNHYTPAMIVVVSSTWGLSLLALIVLWRQRPHSVLDVWLMVVMCAWLFDIALAAVLNAGRFDLGFYAGRIYGLLAASFVLLLLLIENSALYARLVEAHEGERRGHQLLQEKTTELIAANKELGSFSYSVSHDLRAPLRAIDGFALMLEEDHGERLDGEGKRLLSVIRVNSRKMGELIDDLLAFSRLGRQAMSTSEVAMGRLAEEVIKEALDGHGGTPPRIDLAALPPAQGDRALLRQVWVNLISNALKYTGRAREARIEISAYRDGAENVYRIRDNGVGFDMKYYAKLFGVFQRLHRSDEFAGTGVGLAIVQRVVLRHLGRVWAESKPNEGATFYFALPAKAGHE
jgi:signal transduction histidine kinase